MDLRLSWNPVCGVGGAKRALGEAMTTVRLARVSAGGPGNANNAGARNALRESPDIRLAYIPGGGDSAGARRALHHDTAPALLVSFYYLGGFQKHRRDYVFRDWVMDSGAFSAKNSGKKIDLKQYTEACRELLAADDKLVDVFALDAIGDHKASRKNVESMWGDGVKAIPVFHVGSPWDELLSLAREYPKIALGGAVGMSQKRKAAWVGQCFARVWPKWIHGFGMSGESIVLGFPFASVDASNWELAPCAFGSWKTFGKMSVRGGANMNLKQEVRHYMELEQRARVRWKKQMEQIGCDVGCDVRLVDQGTGRMANSTKAFNEVPGE